MTFQPRSLGQPPIGQWLLESVTLLLRSPGSTLFCLLGLSIDYGLACVVRASTAASFATGILSIPLCTLASAACCLGAASVDRRRPPHAWRESLNLCRVRGLLLATCALPATALLLFAAGHFLCATAGTRMLGDGPAVVTAGVQFALLAQIGISTWSLAPITQAAAILETDEPAIARHLSRAALDRNPETGNALRYGVLLVAFILGVTHAIEPGADYPAAGVLVCWMGSLNYVIYRDIYFSLPKGQIPEFEISCAAIPRQGVGTIELRYDAVCVGPYSNSSVDWPFAWILMRGPRH